MNVKNIYIGLTKDQEEVLLYKKDNIFFNLKTKKPISTSMLLEDRLFAYTDIVPTHSMWTSKIIKNYENDRTEMLELKKCFIGNIYQVDDKEVEYKNLDLPMIYWGREVTYTGYLLKPAALLYQKKNHQDRIGDYLDLETGINYDGKYSYDIGDYMISNNSCSIVPFQSVFKDTRNKVKMEKRKVLERYRSEVLKSKK